MCTFNKNNEIISDTNCMTGYKVVRRAKNDKYYSFTTGIQYKPGKVSIPKKYLKYSLRQELKFNDFLSELHPAYDANYKGLTAIFQYKSDAIDFVHFSTNDALCKSMYIDEIIVVEMTLSGSLYTGKYGIWPVYLGSKIDSIKQIK